MPLGMYNRGLHTGNWEVEKKAEDLVTKMLDNDHNIWRALLNIEVFSALFCKRNETFLEAMRWSFRSRLVKLCEELNNNNYTDIEKNAQLNRHICNLPLASIKTGQKYLIPTYNQQKQKWQLVTYKVAPIELTPTYGLGRLVLADNNRLFAYGFTPELLQKDLENNNDNFKPPPRLVFVSPWYPAQQGFLANVYLRFQNIAGFYKACQMQIDHWLQISTEYAGTKATVHAIGQASHLALETAFADSAKYIAHRSITDAYSLPYFGDADEHVICGNQKPKHQTTVQMYKNHYNIGQILPNWVVYNAKKQRPHNDFCNAYFAALVVNGILDGIINTLLIMPCQYLLIPVVRAILNHKIEVALLSILIMVYFMLPGLIMTPIGTALGVFTAVYFGCKLIEPIKVLCNVHEKAEALCHITHHKEEQEDEEYRNVVSMNQSGF